MYLQPAHDHGEPHGAAHTEAFHGGGFPQGLDAQDWRRRDWRQGLRPVGCQEAD